jgi:hypothetical protein
VQLDEPFRTLLGHMRHEIGHYYWPKLVPWARIEEFRSLFGDESADYGANLERHYAQGPPAGWETEYVSAYATMHPYEDWAETFAHYLHTRDVLETAAAAGMVLSGGGVVGEPAADLVSDPAGAVAQGDFDRIVRAWVPLSVGLNAVTRAMGKRDLYPFVLATRPIEKLRFVHHCIAAATRA